MSAPDFYFAVNAMFRHIHDRFGKPALIEYWRQLGRDYYRRRTEGWRRGGPAAVAEDWREYFSHEPQAEVQTRVDGPVVTLEVRVCPAIKHLRDQGRDIVPYFCEHCDHVCGAMGEAAGFRFERSGGMGSCTQRFIQVKVPNTAPAGEAR